jgi:hypothetical protein
VVGDTGEGAAIYALTPAFHQVIWMLVDRLAEADIHWALTGSASFALQGLPICPGDIDVQTDALGAFEIQRWFIEMVVRPVEFSSTENIRSYYGALEIQGITVEIMGDIQKRLPDGAWSPIPDIPQLRQYVELDGLEVPVLDLSYEAEAYELLGRRSRAEELRRWLMYIFP